MFKRVVRIVLIGGVVVVLLMTLAMVWLKIHEDELVFAAERSRQHLLSTLPADAERVAVPIPNRGELAGLVFRAAGNANDAFWVLQLHGNADSACWKSITAVSGRHPVSHPKPECTKTRKPRIENFCGAVCRRIASFYWATPWDPARPCCSPHGTRRRR